MSAELKIVLSEDTSAAGTGSGGAAPEAADIARLDTLRQTIENLRGEDSAKSKEAIQDLLKKAVAIAIGDAAGKLSGESLVGISAQLTAALIAGKPTADILTMAGRLVAPVGGPVGGTPGGGLIVPGVGGPVPLPPDHTVGSGYYPTPGSPSGIMAGLPGTGGATIGRNLPPELPDWVRDAFRMRSQEEQREQDKRDREARQRSYRNVFGMSSQEEGADKSAAQNRFLGQAGNLGMIASGFGLPVGHGVSSIAGGAMGGAQVGAMLGSASMAFPIAGAVMAIAQEIKKQIEELFQSTAKMATAVLSTNPWEVAKGFNELVGKLPVVGGALSEVGGALFGMLDAVNQTAHRMAQYNPTIAYQLADMDLRRMERDMRRSYENEGGIMAAQEQRFELENKLNDLIDKLLPYALNAVHNLTKIADFLISLPTNILDAVFDLLENTLGNLPGIGQTIIDRLEEIRRNTEHEQAGDGAAFVQELLDITTRP
jgi:hypothetical protein